MNLKTSLDSIVKKGFFILFSKISSNLFLFLSTVIVLNYGSTSLLGSYTLFQTSAIIMVSFIDLGITNSSVHFLKKKKFNKYIFYNNSFALVFIITVLLSIISHFISKNFEIYENINFVLICSFFLWVINYFSVKVQTDDNYLLYFLVKISPNFIQFIGIISLVAFDNLVLNNIIKAYFISLILPTIILLSKNLDFREKIKLNILIKIMTFSFRSYKMTLVSSIAKKGDIIIMKYLGGDYIIGLYTIPKQCISFFDEFTKSMTWPLFNKINVDNLVLRYKILNDFIKNQLYLLIIFFIISNLGIWLIFDLFIHSSDNFIIKINSSLILIASLLAPFIVSTNSFSVYIGKLDLLFNIVLISTIIQYAIIFIFYNKIGIYIFPLSFIINQLIISIRSRYILNRYHKNVY